MFRTKMYWIPNICQVFRYFIDFSEFKWQSSEVGSGVPFHRKESSAESFCPRLDLSLPDFFFFFLTNNIPWQWWKICIFLKNYFYSILLCCIASYQECKKLFESLSSLFFFFFVLLQFSPAAIIWQQQRIQFILTAVGLVSWKNSLGC